MLVSCRYQPPSLLSTKIKGIFNNTLRHGVLHSLFQINSELWKFSSLWPAFSTRQHPSTTALELGQRPFSQSDVLALQVGSGGGRCGNPLSSQRRISALQVSWGVGNQGPSTLTCQAWSRASAPQVGGQMRRGRPGPLGVPICNTTSAKWAWGPRSTSILPLLGSNHNPRLGSQERWSPWLYLPWAELP